MPQGFLEKIRFQCLLANLPLQLGNPSTRLRQFLPGTLACPALRQCSASTGSHNNRAFARTARRPKRIGATSAIGVAPFVQKLASHPKLPCQSADVLSGLHARHSRYLQFSAQNNCSTTGHAFLLLELSLILSVSHQGCSPTSSTPSTPVIDPSYPSAAASSAARMRGGDIGRARSRTPVASRTALATAAKVGTMLASPAPLTP